MDVIPGRDGKINSWIRVEKNWLYNPKIQTVHKNVILQQIDFTVEYYRSTFTILCRQII